MAPAKANIEMKSPEGAALAEAPVDAGTPKRKAIMVDANNDNHNIPSETKSRTPHKNTNGMKSPTSTSKSRVWHFPDYGRRLDDPSFSNGDNAMNPPHHRGPRFPPHHSPGPNSRSIYREEASSNEHPDGDMYPDPDTMEEDDGRDDYLSLNAPVGSFAEFSPPRKKTPSKQDDNDKSSKSSKSPHSASSPMRPYPVNYGYPPHHHHHGFFAKSPPPGSSSAYPSMYYPPPPPSGAGPNATSSSHPGHPSRREGTSQEYPSSAPPHHYPYPPMGPGYPYHRYYPHYPPPPVGESWTSPPAYGDSELYNNDGAMDKDNKDNDDDDDNNHSGSLKDAFRRSPGTSPMRRGSPPPGDDLPTTATPEKLNLRSPFRSPPMSQTKKSPFHGSPHLGNYGSFGMLDTPGGTLAAEFSPMGPVLNNPFATGFGGEHPTPPHLSLSRSESSNEDDAAGVEDAPLTASPFSGFIKDLSNFASSSASGLEGVTRSPLRSERRGATDPRSDRPMIQPLTLTQPNDKRRHEGGPELLTSPLGQTSSAKPRKLWSQGPREMVAGQNNNIRLELGSSSLQHKSLESINSMISRSQAPMMTPATRAFSQAPPTNASYRRLTTPMKVGSSPLKKPSATGTKRPTPPSMDSSRKGKLAKGFGKENLTTPGVKRGPCNCKKSRCLKLYCECFANELFCDGCNCADCQNTSAHGAIREKAMKDTRAKNPNAFKPRITVKGPQGMVVAGASPHQGHNMGCRCKRSECLKKYCECFQAGVMCGGKCKCVDCANFAGSQKLIDKRRKIKDQRGAELAMKVAEQAWKGSQHSARKLPVARPAVHGMRPMPSPVATPGGRHPMAMPHMMHPSPSGHPHPYMRPPMMMPHHGHIGYSPMGIHPHVSPGGYGMYPPHPHHPSATPISARESPSASASKRMPGMHTGMERFEMPYTKTVSAGGGKRRTTTKAIESPQQLKLEAKLDKAKDDDSKDSSASQDASDKSTIAHDEANADANENNKQAMTETSNVSPETKKGTLNLSSPPDSSSPVGVDKNANPSAKETPVMTLKSSAGSGTGVPKITPLPATPASTLRLGHDSSLPRAGAKSSSQVATFPYFGKVLPQQSKQSALQIFSFLSESDLKRVAAVCKDWNSLSKDCSC